MKKYVAGINPLVLILTAGVFGIINTEMGVVGILPLIAQKFGVSISQAGWVVSAFALAVALAGPTMPLLFSGVNRKKAMLLTLGIFILSNLVCAFTARFEVLLAARVIPAFFHPVYVSMAFTLAAGAVAKKDAPKAVSKVFLGVSAGMVLGVPLTSFIAGETSFQTAMLFFTLINALVFIATLVYVPSMPVKERASYGKQLGVLKKSVIWYSILSVVLINGALFGFFSFMADYLKSITGLSFQLISMMLLVYGLANMMGNVLAGKLLAKNAWRSVKIIPFALLGTYVLLFALGALTLPMAFMILVLGILAGIAANACQFLLASAAPEAPDFANGLFLTSANLGTAAGTAVCGLFITGFGTTQSAVGGAVLFLTIGIVLVRIRLHRSAQ